MLGVGEVAVSREDVVGLFGVRKLLDSLRNLVRSAPHQRCVDGVIEISIAVIQITRRIQPINLPIRPGNKPIQASGNVELKLAHDALR